MGYRAALEVLKTNLTYTGFPALEIGVPPQALKGPFPAWYVDLPDVDYEYEALQPVFATRSIGLTALFVVVNIEQLPAGVADIGKWMSDVLEPSIRSQIETMVAGNKFENDGSQGSTVNVTKSQFDWRPNQNIGVIKMTLAIRAFL